MTEPPFLLREDRQGATAILTLDYPARRNALALPMRAALIAAMERIEADRDIRAVVLTGSGGTFSAGGDISGMDAADFAAGRERFRTTNRLVRLLIESSKPVIAAVEGWAAGAGLGLALCCDTIVAGSGARFMAGFGRVGLVGDFALLHTLPRRVGEGRARQILLYQRPNRSRGSRTHRPDRPRRARRHRPASRTSLRRDLRTRRSPAGGNDQILPRTRTRRGVGMGT